LQSRLFGFRHQTCSASSPDYSKVLPDLSGRPPRLVWPPIKFLSFYQNLHIWFISYIPLDLCDHVKIMWCLNRRKISDREFFILCGFYLIKLDLLLKKVTEVISLSISWKTYSFSGKGSPKYSNSFKSNSFPSVGILTHP
jgi:hypothetical protein